MDVNNKKVLVVGLARTGLDAVKLLHAKGAHVTVTDTQEAGAIKDYHTIAPLINQAVLGGPYQGNLDFDLVVMSPGVPLHLPFLVKAKALGIPMISEVELAFRHAKGKFIGITGTNGKTTTTALTGEIFKAAGLSTSVVGNIGIPVSSAVLADDHKDHYYVTELSSYQLETVEDFQPFIASFLNLTPDHLARHGSMENYLEAKLKMVQHMGPGSHFFLNADQKPLMTLKNRYPWAKWFSKTSLTSEIGVENDVIVIRDKGSVIPVLPVDELVILGEHNLENALAAVGMSHAAGISPTVMASVLSTFKGVAHRNEFVANIRGVAYYNDSKATNPEASIPALKAMTQPTVLIAGGMDKQSDYTEMLTYFDQVKHLVLYGETKYDMARAAEASGFSDISIVSDLKEAVAKASKVSQAGDAVLLSPACASWDMFKDFEQRGDLFKTLVRALE